MWFVPRTIVTAASSAASSFRSSSRIFFETRTGSKPRVGLRAFDLDEGEPVPVRRDHLDDAVLGFQEGALQLETHLLGRDGEPHLVHHAPERAERQRQRRTAGRLGPRRVVACRQTVQPDAQFRLLALEGDMIVLENLELELRVGGKLADDVVQPARGRRHGAGRLLRGRRNLGHQGRVEIRRRQGECAVSRLQEHVREDLVRGSLLHDALDQAEFASENRGRNCQLHDDSLTNLNRIIQNSPKEVEVVGSVK